MASPSKPSYITVLPEELNVWTEVSIAWGASSHPYGAPFEYELYSSVNEEAFSRIYKGTNRFYLDTIYPWYMNIRYQVRAITADYEASSYEKGSLITIADNNPPTTPGNLEWSDRIVGGVEARLDWDESTDPDGGSIYYYEVELSIDGGPYEDVGSTNYDYHKIDVSNSWNTIQARVRAYDGVLYSPYATTAATPVFHNTAPTSPAHIIIPDQIIAGQIIEIDWGESTDPDAGDRIEYHLESQINGGSWSLIDTTIYLGTSDKIGSWAKIAYRVRAYDGIVYSSYRTSPTRTIRANTPPTAPNGFNITSPVKSLIPVTLTWGFSTDPDGDHVQYLLNRQIDDGHWFGIFRDKYEAREYTDMPDTHWGTVTYSISASDGIDSSSPIILGPITVVHNTPPTMPATISVPESARDGDPIHISWAESEDVDEDPIIYRLLHRINETGMWAHIYEGKNTYYEETAGEWQNVRYKVRAVTELHTSADRISDLVSVAINQPPTRPVSITVPALNSYEEAEISWSKSTDPNSDPVTYVLERRLGTGAWEVIGPNIESTSYTETPLVSWTNGVKYRVKAKDHLGASSLYRESTTVTVKHNIPPTMPILSVPPLRSGVPATITWTASEDPDGVGVTYFLQRKVNSEEIVAILDNFDGLSFVDTPLDHWNTVVYKVRSWDTHDFSPFSTVTVEAVQHFPDFKMKIGGEIKSSANGWVKVNGELRKMLDMWTKVNGQVKKI